ncbi:unnamed protein product [Soboliphyme baturini]|uniref:Uncharacterized protein n=1 Tax=Soboliphyme baturini TaxID=241478 RepID=A0A183J5S4_9BILA|nr:unnamed protein product [Soboliphyme baturini]
MEQDDSESAANCDSEPSDRDRHPSTRGRRLRQKPTKGQRSSVSFSPFRDVAQNGNLDAFSHSQRLVIGTNNNLYKDWSDEVCLGCKGDCTCSKCSFKTTNMFNLLEAQSHVISDCNLNRTPVVRPQTSLDKACLKSAGKVPCAPVRAVATKDFPFGDADRDRPPRRTVGSEDSCVSTTSEEESDQEMPAVR